MTNSKTTPYHPQGNSAERFNRTLLSMLQTLDEEKKEKWSDCVSRVVHAYNCTTSEATGYSPFYLLFGRNPHLPIDLIFGLNEETGCNSLKKTTARGKTYYDQKRQSSVLSPGDRVLVRNMTERGDQESCAHIGRIKYTLSSLKRGKTAQSTR